MAEYFFDLSKQDQREAFEYGRAETGRPAHLLEKDVWVVWTLRALFDSPLAQGTGYVAPIVTLEFGGRATGEPHQVFPVTCDIAAYLLGVSFPSASPLVMNIARTFWEKATAAHVFCAQGRIRSERYARHWHDLAAIARSPHFAAILADRAVASSVARHKSCFFIEKDADGKAIDYIPAATGHLKIVPTGKARMELAKDYAAMLADEVMVGDALSFDELLQACADLEAEVNRAAA